MVRAGRHVGEVCASNARLVVEMDDKGEVAKVRGISFVEGAVRVYVFLRPGLFCHVAKFTTQVTSLAGLRLGGIADGDLAAQVGIKVGSSTSAVSIGGNRLGVDVVHKGTALSWETRERDGEANTLAVGG